MKRASEATEGWPESHKRKPADPDKDNPDEQASQPETGELSVITPSSSNQGNVDIVHDEAIFSEVVHEEQEAISSPETESNAWKNCKKNPGHENFIPVRKFSRNDLPEHYRRQAYLDTITTVSKLTVKLTVSYTSKRRPDDDEFAKYRGKECQRWGTGFLISDIVPYKEIAGYNLVFPKFAKPDQRQMESNDENSLQQFVNSVNIKGILETTNKLSAALGNAETDRIDTSEGNIAKIARGLRELCYQVLCCCVNTYLYYDYTKKQFVIISKESDAPIPSLTIWDVCKRVTEILRPDLANGLDTLAKYTESDERSRDIDYAKEKFLAMFIQEEDKGPYSDVVIKLVDKFYNGLKGDGNIQLSSIFQDIDNICYEENTDVTEPDNVPIVDLPDSDTSHVQSSFNFPKGWERIPTCPCPVCQKSGRPENTGYTILIRTAFHVIFDDQEAKCTEIKFFYDTKDGAGGKTVYGMNVYGRSFSGDQCDITCVTHDYELIQELCRLLELFNQSHPEEDDPPLAVICSHPHGNFKHISVGEWTERLVHSLVSGSDIDETSYKYRTPTCPGSSGAPVLVFGNRDNTRIMMSDLHSHSRHARGGINASGISQSTLL